MATPLLALAFAGLWIWCGHAIACRAMRGAPVTVRWTAAFVIVAWLLCASFLLLASVRAFAWPVALLLWTASAGAAHIWASRMCDPARQLADDAAACASWWTSLTAALRLLLAAGGAIAAVRIVRGLLLPPLAWDGLTYHLVKAAAWIQARGFTTTAGPDAARYYDWFPPYGDVVWAWWMLGARSDAFLPLVGGAIAIAAAAAAYAAARAFGADVSRASLAAAALVFTPAFSAFVATPYIDNLVAALAIAALLFLARAFTTRGAADALTAAAALGVLAGVRVNVVPIAVLGLVCAVWATRRAAAALAAACLGSIAAVPYVQAWIATGSPLYPVTVRMGGRALFPGNDELEWLLGAKWMTPAAIQDARDRLLAVLFLPWSGGHSNYLGLGPGPLLLVAAMPIAVSAAIRSRARGAALFALAMAGLTVASVAGSDSLALRVVWAHVLGRFLLAAVGVAAILAAASPSRAASRLLWGCAVAGIVLGWPFGWTTVDVRAFAAWLPWIAGSIGAAWVCARVMPRRRAVSAPVAIAVALAGALIGAASVRDRLRYDYYEAAATRGLYDLHALGAAPASSWPLWRHLDRAEPLTVALAAGWDGIGHNIYRMPIIGSRLQNRLVYVPVSRDGSIVDYRLQPDASTLSCARWLRRLVTSSADYLVLLPPLPPEAAWARSMPSVLVPELEVAGGGAVAYRIDRTTVRQPSAVACTSTSE